MSSPFTNEEFMWKVVNEIGSLENTTVDTTPRGSFEAGAPVSLMKIGAFCQSEDIMEEEDIIMDEVSEGMVDNFSALWEDKPIPDNIEELQTSFGIGDLEIAFGCEETLLMIEEVAPVIETVEVAPVIETVEVAPVIETVEVAPVIETVEVAPVFEMTDVSQVVDKLSISQQALNAASEAAAFSALSAAEFQSVESVFVTASEHHYIISPSSQAELAYNLLLAISQASKKTADYSLLLRFFNGDMDAVEYIMAQVKARKMVDVVSNGYGGEKVTIARRHLTRLFKHTKSVIISNEVVVDGVVVSPIVTEGLECLTKRFVDIRTSRKTFNKTKLNCVDNNQIRKYFSALHSSWEKKVDFASTFKYISSGSKCFFEFNW